MTRSHLDTVKEKIASLKKLESALTVMVAECNRGDVPDCQIVDTLFEMV